MPDIPYPLAATHDGGATWTQVNGPLAEMSQLASYHGVSYAVFHAPFADASPGVFAFAASSDGLHTWHRIDGALACEPGSDPVDARAVRGHLGESGDRRTAGSHANIVGLVGYIPDE